MMNFKDDSGHALVAVARRLRLALISISVVMMALLLLAAAHSAAATAAEPAVCAPPACIFNDQPGSLDFPADGTSPGPLGLASLRISTSGLPSDKSARVTIAHKRYPVSVTLKVRGSLYVPVFLPGDWKISVKPVTDGESVHYPRTRMFNIHVERHAAAEVVFEFDNQLSNKLRHAPSGSVSAFEGPDESGKYVVLVNDPKRSILPDNVLTADISPQTPEGMLVIVESVSRDGDVAAVEARAGTLDDLGPRYRVSVDQNVVLPPYMKTSPEDPPYDDSMSCGLGVRATMKGNVGFDSPTIRVAVDIVNVPSPKASLDFGISATVTASVAISGAGQCGIDRRIGSWPMPPIPVVGLPVVITPVIRLQLRGSVATGAEASVSASQSIRLDAGMSGTSLGGIEVHGSESHSGSTSGLTGNDFVEMKASAGPVVELRANAAQQIGELTGDVFLRYVANRNVGPTWGVYGGIEAGGKIGLMPWVTLGANAILQREYLIADSGDGDDGGDGGGGGGTGLYDHRPTNIFDIGINSGYDMNFMPTTIPAFGRPVDMSCSSPALCAVVTDALEGLVWDGFGWQTFPQLEISPKTVTCTRGKCVAYDSGGDSVVYSSGQWSLKQEGPAFVSVNDSACAPTRCIAVGAAGSAVEDGARYQVADSTLDDLNAISCAQTEELFCMVAGQVVQNSYHHLAYWTLTDAGWSRATIIGPRSSHPLIIELSCSSDQFCMARDANGDLRTYSDGSWTSVSRPPSPVTTVSCPTDTYCVAADVSGNTKEWVDGGWQQSRPITNTGNVILKLSCPSTSLCGGLEGEPYSSGGGGGGGGGEEDPT